MKNNVTIANFNITFGEKEEPLLNFFENIIYPAFTSDLKRIYKIPGTTQQDAYYFIDTKIKEFDGEIIMTGKLVHDTEVKVKYAMENGVMVRKFENHPTAPYSTFYIFLRNHRMVLIRNQKESPMINSFQTTSRKIIDIYIRKQNKKRKEEKLNSFPLAIVNVIGIPVREELEKAILAVKKINRLSFRFYPLNGDIDYTGIFDGLTYDMRMKTGAKTGNFNLNSPDDKRGVIELIDASQGLVEATLKVEYDGKRNGTISNDNISERITWELNDEDVNNAAIVVPMAKELSGICFVSEENNKIYKGFLGKLKKLISE